MVKGTIVGYERKVVEQRNGAPYVLPILIIEMSDLSADSSLPIGKEVEIK